jgi:hypothetical protein
VIEWIGIQDSLRSEKQLKINKNVNRRSPKDKWHLTQEDRSKTYIKPPVCYIVTASLPVDPAMANHSVATKLGIQPEKVCSIC